MTPQELFASMEKGEQPILLDIRESHERAKNTLIEGSFWISLKQILEGVEEIPFPKSSKIVVFSNKDGRSEIAKRVLLAEGFQATKLDGGYHAWQNFLRKRKRLQLAEKSELEKKDEKTK